MVSDETVLGKMHAAISEILDQDTASPLLRDLYSYCRPLADRKSLETYIRHKVDTVLLSGCEVRGSVLLDAGCGFGITCLLFALMGAKESHGVDVMMSRLTAFKTYLERLNLKLPIYPKLQSVSALDYPADFFDIVFSNEAISHYRDLPSFFQEMHRILKKGGALVIADGNNGANPSLVQRSQKVWQRFEQGPTGSIGRHKIEKSYVTMRREIVQEQFPHIEERELDALSRGTFGMDREQVLEAGREYAKSGRLPESFYTGKECPLNPITGAVIERFFQPVKLAEEMRSFGLKSEAYAYFGGANGASHIRIANKLLSWFTPLTIRFARGFRIVAIKEG